jgi:hypothetical protein
MTPVAAAPVGGRPRPDSLLLVVDTTNAPGGFAATIWLDDLALVR